MDQFKISTGTDSVLSHVQFLKQTSPDEGNQGHPSPELFTALLLEALLEERNTAWEAVKTFRAIKQWYVAAEEMELHMRALNLSGQIIRDIRTEQKQAINGKE